MTELPLLVTTDELAAHLDDARWRIVDCRFDLKNPGAGRAAYLRSHVPGAVFADLERDLSAPEQAGTGRHPLPGAEALARVFGRLGIDRETRVVAYDASGGAIAARAWWLLRWLGHERAALLDGGWPQWVSAGLPAEAGERRVAARRFEADPRPGRVVTTEELAAREPGRPGITLVDAREARRYRGEFEPIDPVAGHVPGALNLPFSDCLGDDGRFRDRASLEGRWREVLGPAPGEGWAVMCGSGVTACHLAFSALLAGYPEPRLYAGSFSEWIREPERPVATGATPG